MHFKLSKMPLDSKAPEGPALQYVRVECLVTTTKKKKKKKNNYFYCMAEAVIIKLNY